MSIFDICPFTEGIITEDKLKNDILVFFKSDFYVAHFYTDNGYNLNESCYSIKLEELIDYFLVKNKIPLLFKHLDLVSVFNLIELFLNIFNNYLEIVKDYINNSNECGPNCRYQNYSINKFDNNLHSYILSFLKYKNIIVKKTKNKIYILCFDSPILLEKSSYEIKETINKYLKIRNIKTKESLVDKQNILSGLKNYLGKFFGKDNFIKSSLFLKIDVSALKMYWQSLFSHKDNIDKNVEHNKIKEKWNKMTLLEKHETIDCVFDCVVFINYKINIK